MRFFDPRTGRGVVLAGVSVPVVHECGFMELDRSWNYHGVCSPFWRAYVNFDPGAAIVAGGRRIPLRPGRVVIIPEEVVYSCHPKSCVRHLWIHFSLPDGQRHSAPVDVVLSSARFAECGHLAARIRAGASDLPALCAALLLQLLSALPSSARSAATSESWLAFVRWIESRLGRPPPVAEMAARQSMSERAFHRWFRSVADASPAGWVLRRRIREACRHLRFGSLSIEQIAEATGFADRHHFTRAFRAETGTTPATYRSH